MAIVKGVLVLLAVVCLVQGRGVHFKYPTKVDAKAACSISINGGLPEPQPLLLKPGGSNDGYGFYLPADATGQVVVAESGVIRLACPGNGNYLRPLGTGVQEANAVCVGGTDFTIDGRAFTFRELACNSNPFHTARQYASLEQCHNGAIMIEIGFLVDTEFFKTIDICFDEATRNSLWSKFQLVSGIGGYQSGFPSPSFVADNFYPGLNPDQLYSRTTQRDTVSRILQSTALGNQYIHDTDDYFMSRGHMTAKADFVYGSQHRATYHFINVAPQWQTFNGGNWNTMEQNVRAFTDARKYELEVYTGTYGVTTLKDVNNNEQEIWIYWENDSTKAIPAPKLYWKVVYNPATKLAIALLGVNNPHIPAPDASHFICTNVCDQVNWLTWKPTDVKLGISYCCEVDAAFRAQVPSLPDFEVTGLLT